MGFSLNLTEITTKMVNSAAANVFEMMLCRVGVLWERRADRLTNITNAHPLKSVRQNCEVFHRLKLLLYITSSTTF
jgi:hypothetical protein